MLWRAVAHVERQLLEGGAGREHAVEVPVRHENAEDLELPKLWEVGNAVREVGGVRKLPETKVEAAKFAAAENHGEGGGAGDGGAGPAQ